MGANTDVKSHTLTDPIYVGMGRPIRLYTLTPSIFGFCRGLLSVCWHARGPELRSLGTYDARLEKSPPAARPFALAGGRFFGRGYLVMAIYPLTMAGLVPLPKQFSHVNQSTHVFRGQFFELGIVDSKFYLRSFETHVLARARQRPPRRLLDNPIDSWTSVN